MILKEIETEILLAQKAMNNHCNPDGTFKNDIEEEYYIWHSAYKKGLEFALNKLKEAEK